MYLHCCCISGSISKSGIPPNVQGVAFTQMWSQVNVSVCILGHVGLNRIHSSLRLSGQYLITGSLIFTISALSLSLLGFFCFLLSSWFEKLSRNHLERFVKCRPDYSPTKLNLHFSFISNTRLKFCGGEGVPRKCTYARWFFMNWRYRDAYALWNHENLPFYRREIC